MPSQRISSTKAWIYSSRLRSRSVSSMRSRNTPLWRNASKALNRAVRAFPKWMRPVGLGAKRVFMGACIGGTLYGKRCVRQRWQPLNSPIPVFRLLPIPPSRYDRAFPAKESLMKQHMKLLISALLLAVIASCHSPEQTAQRVEEPQHGPKVRITTNLGDIVVELYPEKAPKTVENFLQYVNDGF